MRNKGTLLKELYTNISTTGAITFSSKPLVDKMLSYADFIGAKTIVELGGGDGSITAGIIEKMDKDTTLLVFEVNEYFCKEMEKAYPQSNIKIINDSAANIDKYLNGTKADLIFSSLPFSLIDKPTRKEICEKSRDYLLQEGKFIQICYSYLLRYQFKNYFNEIETHFTLKNFPPAFIMVCN
ncbi:MAG: ribose ABC transporter permease [Mongoliibacter sp.]|uniref:class I SAM-dependent methyltransferase n=1 Tax=Mongoliibacter sp. TaxID=2022438 RepID=UPI0012F3CBAB|nr:methyltransferase [Mongoliibacter sp.]TVP43956.1 MAG: ribose ABC transporter permease [Mongoliibacter sp.]